MAAKQSSEEEQSPALRKQSSDGSAVDQVNDEMITPYVIVNKTDLTVIVKRLFKKEDAEN